MPTPLQLSKKLVSSSTHTADVDENTSSRFFILDKRSKFRFLVDCGSDLSIIPATNRDRRLGPHSLVLHAANKSTIKTYGYRLIELDLGLNARMKWRFVIADVSTPILGADFIKSYNLLIDLKTKKLIDGNTKATSSVMPGETQIHSVTTIADDHQFFDLLSKYKEITMPSTIGKHVKHNVLHYIETDCPPVASRMRRLRPEKLAIAKREIEAMIDLGICRPSKSPWASPLHIVPKKKPGEWRVVGDYRRLNAVTKPDKYPVPHLHDIANSFTGKNIFSVIDFIRAYHQIPVRESDVEKTAVITPFGLYEFTTMQFGLCNAGSTFNRFMHQVLGDLDFVVCYFDDLCIASTDMIEHKDHLETVFKRLSEYGLVVNADKCLFAKTDVNFCGYNISSAGVRPLQARVEAIANYKLPELVKELRRFLAILNTYKRFIKHATHKQLELRKLIPGNRKNDNRRVEWNALAKEAFEDCKKSLAESTLLNFPVESAPMALKVDASDFAAGASLEQFVDDHWQPLGFYSEKFNDAQKKYSTFDRELTAIYMAIKYFRHHLEERQFKILTDHRPITGAMNKKSDNYTARQTRQLDFISQFTTDIEHVSGVLNVVPDAMSRVMEITLHSSIDYAEIARQQKCDDELKILMSSNNTSLQLKMLLPPKVPVAMICDTSQASVRPYVPLNCRDQVLRTIHEPVHPGVKGTVSLATKSFVWPDIRKDAAKFVKFCLDCQLNKVQRHNRQVLDEFVTPTSRFEHIHIDLVERLPSSNGQTYILTMIDRYTRWPEAAPLSDKRASSVAKALLIHWISRFGCPTKITTDQGTQFESELYRELCNLLGMTHVRTTSYHPQSNGMIERFHRTLKASLMAYKPNEWTDKLPLIMLGLRSVFREDIKCCPAELVYGTTLRLPGQFFSRNEEFTPQSELVVSLRELFDNIRPVSTSNHARPKPFVQKDLKSCTHVFVRVDRVKAALERPYEGPYEVKSRFEKYFDIIVKGVVKRISIDRLKAAFVPNKALTEYPQMVTDTKTKVTPSGHRVRFLV